MGSGCVAPPAARFIRISITLSELCSPRSRGRSRAAACGAMRPPDVSSHSWVSHECDESRSQAGAVAARPETCPRRSPEAGANNAAGAQLQASCQRRPGAADDTRPCSPRRVPVRRGSGWCSSTFSEFVAMPLLRGRPVAGGGLAPEACGSGLQPAAAPAQPARAAPGSALLRSRTIAAVQSCVRSCRSRRAPPAQHAGAVVCRPVFGRLCRPRMADP